LGVANRSDDVAPLMAIQRHGDYSQSTCRRPHGTVVSLEIFVRKLESLGYRVVLFM